MNNIEYNIYRKQWRQNKIKEGYKDMHLLVPASVAKEIKMYYKICMNQYRLNNIRQDVIKNIS